MLLNATENLFSPQKHPLALRERRTSEGETNKIPSRFKIVFDTYDSAEFFTNAFFGFLNISSNKNINQYYYFYHYHCHM